MGKTALNTKEDNQSERNIGSMNNYMKLEFSAESVNESFARVTVAAFAAQLDPTLEDITELKTAVSEAVTNAIIHGYDGATGAVEITAELTDNSITVTVSDKGKGIENIEQARKPLYTSKPTEGRSGMGFTVMEMFMDKISVESSVGSGTKVCMIKHFAKA